MFVLETLDRSGLARLLGSLIPGLGLLTSVPNGTDQLRVRGDSANVNVSVASALSPSALLFPFSNSGVPPLSSSLYSFVPSDPPASSSFPLLPSSSSVFASGGLPSIAPSFPPPSLPVFSVPSVVPSVLSLSTPVPPSSVPLPPSLPPFPSVSLPGSSHLAFFLPSAPLAYPMLSSSSFFSAPLPPPSSFSSATLFLFVFFFPSSFFFFLLCFFFFFFHGFRFDSGLYFRFVFGMLGFSTVFSAGWFGFSLLRSSFFPHLSADASRDFSSGSSLFLSALRSCFCSSFCSGTLVVPTLSASLPPAPPSAPAMAPSAFPLLSLSYASSLPPVSTPLPSAPPLGF